MGPEFIWDGCQAQLAALSREVWSGAHQHVSPLQRVADFFFVRSSRRCWAITTLFREGLYVEAASIVRNGFEDWVGYAYVLNTDSLVRWDDLSHAMSQTDARVYEGFRDLYGPEAAKRYFGDIPDDVAAQIDKKDHRGPSLRAKAREVGLEPVYRIAYPYLSAYAHSTTRPFKQLFDTNGSVTTARIPVRDASDEGVLALWAFWFELRVHTLAGRAYDADWEGESDAWLSARGTGIGFGSSVLMRESIGHGRSAGSV